MSKTNYQGLSEMSTALADAIIDTSEDVAARLATESHLRCAQSCVVESSGAYWAVVVDDRGRASMSRHGTAYAAEQAATR